MIILKILGTLLNLILIISVYHVNIKADENESYLLANTFMTFMVAINIALAWI